MSAFLCPKTKTQQEEPCSTCDDCPGDAQAVLHLATFMYIPLELLTSEVEGRLINENWERI